MKVLESLQTRAAAHPARIVLSEGHDPRIVEAALRVTKRNMASIVLVGPEHEELNALKDRFVLKAASFAPLSASKILKLQC